MSNDKRLQYEGATVIDQAFLDAAHDNLVNKLELIVDIEKPAPGGYIRASDRNKYVVAADGSGTFYEALLVFPVIKRTVGQFLSTTLEFSTLELELANVDGRFNELLPGGLLFGGWVGKSVTVRLGLGETASTYHTIFKGFITEQGGFKRNVSSIGFVARDRFDSVNKSFPDEVLTVENYPDIEPDKDNITVPIIYGDWTVNVEPGLASIPAIVVNGADQNVNGTIGNTGNLRLVIANHPLPFLDTGEVYLRRGDKAWRVPVADVVGVDIAATPANFQIAQLAGTMVGVTPDTDDEPLAFGKGDEFFVKVRGKELPAGFDDNIVAQAKDILKVYGGMTDAEFHSNWSVLRGKGSPAQSAVALVKSRVWVQEPEKALEYALSLLEQVRLEAFIDRNLELKLLPLHLDEFDPAPVPQINNWDVEQKTFKLQLDEQMNFNRAKGVYNYLPNRKENLSETKIYKNQAAIDQAGKPVSKKIIYPNLYDEQTVLYQLIETLRMTSAYLELVDVNLTWRSLLLDIGDFVRLNVQIQSTVLENVIALVRDVGYDPAGVKRPFRMWSLQMVPFPGYSPGYTGTVGGDTAIIEVDEA